jgi:hypothetical protein
MGFKELRYIAKLIQSHTRPHPHPPHSPQQAFHLAMSLPPTSRCILPSGELSMLLARVYASQLCLVWYGKLDTRGGPTWYSISRLEDFPPLPPSLLAYEGSLKAAKLMLHLKTIPYPSMCLQAHCEPTLHIGGTLLACAGWVSPLNCGKGCFCA